MAGSEFAGVVVTCEHASNRIPARYRDQLSPARHLLDTHRGWDPGAQFVAGRIARHFDWPLVVGKVTRLLVDLNRSPTNPARFSPYTRALPRALRDRIERDHYQPYRGAVIDALRAASHPGRPVLHLSIHSFTPRLRGQVRRADFGLLYDPSRSREVALCDRWHAALNAELPRLTVRRNYPYTGVSDGLIPGMRRMFAPNRYVGVELEMNQKHLRAPDRLRTIAAGVVAALEIVLRGA